MKSLHLLFLLAGLAACQAVSFFNVVLDEWNQYKLQHNKKYESDTEDKFRMKVFMDSKSKIAKHNSRFERGEVSFRLGMNAFGDMLQHEFVSVMNGFNRTRTRKLRSPVHTMAATFLGPANVELPRHVDWRDVGAVTGVKNQGHCGSCWSFSATGSLEGQHFRKTGVLVSLSEQNLIDCSADYGNDGCSGGLMDNAFRYVKDNGGIDTESSYPYRAEDEKCMYNPSDSGASDVGYVDIESGSEHRLKQAVATVGPISVAIDASSDEFRLYHSGVFFNPQCSSEALDHGVLVVGYGTTEEGEAYWLVKNSWGERWGLDGYVMLARNRDNHCGIATQASYPLV